MQMNEAIDPDVSTDLLPLLLETMLWIPEDASELRPSPRKFDLKVLNVITRF